MGWDKQLDLWHVLVIAEKVSGRRAERLAAELHLAGIKLPLDRSGGFPVQLGFYADTVEDAVRLCAWIVRNLPLPEKDRRVVAYLCMRLLLENSPWPQPGRLTKEIAGTMRSFSAGAIGEPRLTDWVHSWVAQGSRRLRGDATA